MFNGRVIIRQGVLMKEGKVQAFAIKRWQSRYVVLTDRYLYYWANAMDFNANK